MSGESHYSLEHAKSGRGLCKSTHPLCRALKDDGLITKGELRLLRRIDKAIIVTLNYHWRCVTDSIVQELIAGHDSAADIKGFDSLSPNAQQLVQNAFALGYNPQHHEMLELLTPGRKQELDSKVAQLKAEAEAANAPKPKPKAPRKQKKQAATQDDDDEAADADDDGGAAAPGSPAAASKKKAKGKGGKAPAAKGGVVKGPATPNKRAGGKKKAAQAAADEEEDDD